MFCKRRFCKPRVLALAQLREKKKLEQEEKNNGEGKQISRNEISQLTTVTYVRQVVYESPSPREGDEAAKRGAIREAIHLGGETSR